MKPYSEAAVERMMKVQEVILRAMAGKLAWWQAAEILGVSCRTMRRWLWTYQQHGRPSPNRVPVELPPWLARKGKDCSMDSTERNDVAHHQKMSVGCPKGGAAPFILP